GPARLLEACLIQVRAPPEGRRGDADLTMKERRERSKAVEPDLEADLGYRQLGPLEQGPRAGDPQPYQVVVRSLAESAPKEPMEVMGRQAGLARDRGQGQPLGEAGMQEVAAATEPAIQLFSRAGADGRDRGD